MTEMIFGGVNPKTELAKIGARFRISEIKGREIIKKNIIQKETPATDGALYFGRTIPPRTIEVVFSIQAADRETLLEAVGVLSQVFASNEEQALSFTDQDGTFYGVQSDSSEDEFGEVLYKGSVSIFCSDPFRYGNNVQAGGASPYTVTAETNYRALPVITITTSSSTTKVILTVNGRELSYETGQTIASGTQIKVDGAAKEVRIGGVLKVLEVSGWFPYFVGGANQISTNVASNLSIQYRERNV